MMLGEQPEWIPAELVTGGYFSTLGVKAERGRLLTQRDLDDAAADPVCVISYRLWKNRFQGAEDIIGRRIQLNTHAYRIVGVSERGFSGTDLQRPADLEVPATRLGDYMPGFVGVAKFDWRSRLWLFRAMARLKPGATRAGAAAQLTHRNEAFLAAAKLQKYATKVELGDGAAGLQTSAAKLARPAVLLLAVSLLVLLIA
jgi:hypothetical protein